MFDRLEGLERRYEEVMAAISDPEVSQDAARFRALMKEQAELQPIVEAYRGLNEARRDMEDAVTLLEEFMLDGKITLGEIGLPPVVIYALMAWGLLELAGWERSARRKLEN